MTAPLLGVSSEWEFLLLYALIGVVTLAAGKFAQHVALGLLERTERAPEPVRLEPGKLPREADLPAVALLAGGLPGLCELVMSIAATEGWLTRRGDTFELGPLPARPHPLSAKLYPLLPLGRATPWELSRAVTAVAKAELGPLEQRLVAAGLLRPLLALALGGALMAAIALGIVWLGLARFEQQLAAGAPLSWPLLGAIVTFGVALLALSRPSPLSARGRAYLAWLLEATEALRRDVERGDARRDEDTWLANISRRIVLGLPLPGSSAPPDDPTKVVRAPRLDREGAG